MSSEFEATVLAELRGLGRTVARIDKNQAVTDEKLTAHKEASELWRVGHDERHVAIEGRLDNLDHNVEELDDIANQGKGALGMALRIGGVVTVIIGAIGAVVKYFMRNPVG